MRRLPMAIPRELDDLMPDVPAGIFDETFRIACERLDRFIGALTVELAASLGLDAGELPPPEVLLAERGWRPAGALSIRWLLETLELYGAAERRGDRLWHRAQPPAVASAQLRAEAERILPSARPAYEVLSLSAATLPSVLRGELRGEDALFGPAAVGLWFDYFSNSNPHYAPNNALTALAVERNVGPHASVLEVGGGGGSAAQALLRSLAAAGKDPGLYVFTEPQPAFLRRGVRAVQPLVSERCEFRSMRFDIDFDAAEQGLASTGFDVIFGVNTVHLARDVVGTLRRLRQLLRPGGVVVVGELLRPTLTAPVHLELPFTLLTAYGQVSLADGIRSRPGFMCAEGWRQAFRAAGFGEITTLPVQLERCAEIYPGFYCGAVAARA
jgi:SAM-dependent methyltransferase